jgi:hypothetical protein
MERRGLLTKFFFTCNIVTIKINAAVHVVWKLMTLRTRDGDSATVCTLRSSYTGSSREVSLLQDVLIGSGATQSSVQ